MSPVAGKTVDKANLSEIVNRMIPPFIYGGGRAFIRPPKKSLVLVPELPGSSVESNVSGSSAEVQLELATTASGYGCLYLPGVIRW